MDYRLVSTLTAALAVVGCARDNPAFDHASGSETEPSDAEGPDDEAESNDEDPTEGEVCELLPGQPMDINLGSGCSSDEPTQWNRWYKLVDVPPNSDSEIWAGLCDEGTINCQGNCGEDTPLNLKFSPVDISSLPAYGDCIHVKARRAPTNNPSACIFDTLSIEIIDTQLVPNPVPVLLGRRTGGTPMPELPSNASPMLAAFDPAPMVADVCECDVYPDECQCDLNPEVYEFDVGLNDSIGLHDPPAQIMRDNRGFEFEVHDAFRPGECEAEPSISWSLVRND